MMIFHKLCIKRCIGFVLLLLFCFLYQFIFEGKNSFNEFYSIFDYTVNTSGYLVYIHTATFYTAFFVFILGKNLVKTDNQTLIRSSRKNVFLKNTIISVTYSIAFSICFFFPHLIFMRVNYSAEELFNINFYKLMIIQILAYILYYVITSSIVLLVYYISLNCVLSQLMSIGLNMLLMFGYRILHIKSPIETTLVYTKYYGGLSEHDILFQLLPLLPIILIMLISAYVIFSEKDVL